MIRAITVAALVLSLGACTTASDTTPSGVVNPAPPSASPDATLVRKAPQAGRCIYRDTRSGRSFTQACPDGI